MLRGAHAGPGEADTRLDDLLELTTHLTAALDSAEIARIVVDEARTSVGATAALLWLVDDPPGHASLVRAIGIRPEVEAQYARIALDASTPMGGAMLRREPRFLESRVEFGDRYETAAHAVAERVNQLSGAYLPLVAHGRAIGCLSLVFPQARGFDARERRFLTALAHHAAEALERASHCAEREQRTRRRLEGLQHLTAALSSAATIEDVASLATRVGAETLGFTGGAVWGVDDHGDLRLLSEYGMRAQDRVTFACIPADSPLPAARAARDRRPLWVESERAVAAEPPSFIAVATRDNMLRGYGLLPLVRGGRVLGVLAFSAGRPRGFLPEERAFMTTIADHCADALARARLLDDARSSKQLLQRVLECLPVGVVVTRGPDGRLVLWNDALGRIWGLDDVPPVREERRKLMRPQYPDGRPMPPSMSPVERALHGETVDALEVRIERQDGTIGWIQVSAAPVFRDDGTVDVAVGTFLDTTAEREARAAADDAGRAKDEFLAMLGHELRNPLTPIVTALDLMDLRGGEEFRAERTIIARQVHHVQRLVDDLLDISRITRGEVALAQQTVEVAQPIASAIETSSPRFEQRSQSLTVSVPGRGLPVVVDPGRLSQVVANLLTNASKYTEPGGSITISAALEDGDVCIRVRDTGIGIEPDVLPRVFDPFVQAKRALDRSQGGIGLGLTIARNLVELNGGSISAHSDGVGHGSEFVIRLPHAGAGLADAAAAEPRATAPASAQRRVLVVDDNADIADTLAEVLQALGCAAHIAYDGPTAIAMAATLDADLALIDIGLPVMDGYELARHLRQSPATSAMRLVAVTGYGQPSDAQQAIEAGFDEHVVKPFELDTLRDVLARAPRG
jgi:PAS domain S-box-containing protein